MGDHNPETLSGIEPHKVSQVKYGKDLLYNELPSITKVIRGSTIGTFDRLGNTCPIHSTTSGQMSVCVAGAWNPEPSSLQVGILSLTQLAFKNETIPHSFRCFIHPGLKYANINIAIG